MRIALVLLWAALSGCQPRDDASASSPDAKAPAFRYLHASRTVAGEAFALGYGRPAVMYRVGRDGALSPVGTVDLGGPEGGIEYAPFAETDAIWFLAPGAAAAVHWDGGTATRIELGDAPQVTDCDGCRLELVGQRRIVPGRDGGAAVVRNFADPSRAHRYCEVVRVAPTEVLARDVFPGLCAPVGRSGAPAVMITDQERTVFRVLDETGWSNLAVPGVSTYEGWVDAEGSLYRVDRDKLERVGLSASDPGSALSFPGYRLLALSPARAGGLWGIVQGVRGGNPEAKPPSVLVRLEGGQQTSTSPALPDASACTPAAPEELADGRVVVPCRGWDGRVNAVDVLVQGQWQKLRSAEQEAERIRVEQLAASRRLARKFAPWLTNTSPLSLVGLHLLFMGILWLISRTVGRGAPAPRRWGWLAALLGGAAGLLFGFFEQFASGWWRNDSLFPSFAAQEWWLAKFTATVAGASLGVRLSRLGTRSPRSTRSPPPRRVASPGRPGWRITARTVRSVGLGVVLVGVAAAIGLVLTRDPSSFRSEQFLIAGRLPKDWSSRESPGTLGFSVSRTHAHGRGSRGAAWVKGVTVDPEGTLARLRDPSSSEQVTEVMIDAQPALRVQKETRRSYYVKNRSGELLVIRFEEATPVEESDAFMASLRFLPGRKVDPDARFELSGKVSLLEGDCMPPAECKPRGVRRELVIRGAGPELSAGEVVARVMSDGDGDFALELPPGRYHLFAIEDGKEWCRRSGEYGRCGVRIIDRDIETSVVIDRAGH
ncbi:hypothetical protein [Archangium primigenium]|uniref:hypothetical protein n=1 Tax=[Archangium] primigenium TaxID=2792470 RepID=UPI00195B505E|nr:hypothetical protein [Archangium primigenium]MBM7113864.1 hypothetical protein [Archangium primigenium]